MSQANEVQHGGDHYKTQAIQVWDYITSNGIPYLEGNAIKYLSRWRAKGGLQDLLKAKHYVEKLIENEQQRLATEKAQAEAPPYPELAGPGDAFRPGKNEYQRPTKRKKR